MSLHFFYKFRRIKFTAKYVQVVTFQFFDPHFNEERNRFHSSKLGKRIVLAQHFPESGWIVKKDLRRIRISCQRIVYPNQFDIHFTIG